MTSQANVPAVQSDSARAAKPRKQSVFSPMTGADGSNIVNLNAWKARMLLSGRGLLGRLLGGSFGGKRDLYEAFGWDKRIQSDQMWTMYSRGGIARRIVHAYPDAVWGNPPTFDGTTKQWTEKWNQIVEDTNLWTAFHRLDRLSQLGQYAVMVIGYDDGARLDTPVNPRKARNLIYLQPYSDRSAIITKWGTDPSKANFNLPEEYTIYPDQSAIETGMLGGGRGVTAVPNRGSFKVHHSRVLHVTQSQLESEVFGTPPLWAVWNYLTDLQKVVGSSAESYWQTANRGMHANLDKDVDLDPEDEAALSEEIDEYHNGQRRFIRTRGVDIKSLGADVADPKGPFETIVTLIAGTTSIPKRILLGSESGHNASTQDKGTWAEKIIEYRTLTATPNFIKPFIKALTAVGVLPATSTAKKPTELWPDAYRLSPLEEAQRANQRATAVNNLGLGLKNIRNLMDRVEAREWVGLKDDGKTEPLDIAAVPDPNADDNNDQKAGDGGVNTPGPGAGTTGTPTSDSNDKGGITQN